MVNDFSGMPQMSAAFGGWTQSIEMTLRRESIVDGFLQVKETQVAFQGTMQPLGAREIQLKPEGQRAFTWWQIHCEGTEMIFDTGDRVIWQGKYFKIMGNLDYRLNNYVEYHAIEDYQKRPGSTGGA